MRRLLGARPQTLQITQKSGLDGEYSAGFTCAFSRLGSPVFGNVDATAGLNSLVTLDLSSKDRYQTRY